MNKDVGKESPYRRGGGTYETAYDDRRLVVPERVYLAANGLDNDETTEHANEGPEYDDDVPQTLLVLYSVPEEVRNGTWHVLPRDRWQPWVHIFIEVEVPRRRGDRELHIG